MKRITYTIEFFLISLIFVIPPILTKNSQKNVFEVIYPLQTFIFTLFAIVLYIQFRDEFTQHKKNSSINLLINSSQFFITFGLIVLISVLFETAGYFIESLRSETPTMLFPKSLSGRINFFAGTTGAAFYEEVLYRLYLPEIMKKIFITSGSEKKKTSLSRTFECVAIALFAAGHLYIGILGVLNAIFAGIILRRCTIKTKGIWVSFFTHTIYNFMVYIIAFNT